MASTVAVTIVGRTYELKCDPGQEDYLRSLAEGVDRRATELLKLVGQVGDARLLVMVALSMADEIVDLKRAADRWAEGGETAAAPSTDGADQMIASGIEALARRIEAIADHLEKA